MSTAPLPSAADVAALAALAALAAAATPNSPATNAASPVSSVLSEVFQLCRHEWVHNFLFTDEMSPLVALTAPLNQSASMACTVRFANVDAASNVAAPATVFAPALSASSTTATSASASSSAPTSASAPAPASASATPQPPPFNMHMSGDFVFVPAFSAGSLGVGFGIHKLSTHYAALWEISAFCGPSKKALTHFRFVRDDADSLLLLVHDDKEKGVVKIDYMKNITATTRRRAFLCLSRPALQPFLDARASAPLSSPPAPPLHAVLVCESSMETRACPICNAPRGAWCSCALDAPVPRHPFDFDAVRRSMLAHTGSFEGVSSAYICPAAKHGRSATLGARMMVEARPNDLDLVARFTRWAIADNLVTKPLRSPLHDVFPSAAGVLLGDVDRPDEENCASRQSHLESHHERLVAPATPPSQPMSAAPSVATEELLTLPSMSAPPLFSSTTPMSAITPPAIFEQGAPVASIADNDILLPDALVSLQKSDTPACLLSPCRMDGSGDDSDSEDDNPAPRMEQGFDGTNHLQSQQPSLFDIAHTPSVSLDGAALNTPQLDVSALLQEALGAVDTTTSKGTASFDAAKRALEQTKPQHAPTAAHTYVPLAVSASFPTSAPAHISVPATSSITPSRSQPTALSPPTSTPASAPVLLASKGSSAVSILEDCSDDAHEEVESAPDSVTDDSCEDEYPVPRTKVQKRESAAPIAPRMTNTKTAPRSGVGGPPVLQQRAATVVKPRPIAAAPVAPSNACMLLTGQSGNSCESDGKSTSSGHTLANGAGAAGPAGNGEKGHELRAQLRRQRNREAAQRSNLRRKIRNDTLKKNLRDSQGRAAELRTRELVLREENLKLRRLLP